MARLSTILLIEDVNHLGLSGDVVKVKPGYARNWLLPQKKGITATKHTLRMRDKLQEARKAQAASDLLESQELVTRLEGVLLNTCVKVDPEGHMYGSVGIHDILSLLEKQKGIKLEKSNIDLAHSIKSLGNSQIKIKLKEGIHTEISLEISAER